MKMIDYEVIDIQDEQHTYPVLVGRPWGRKMKASISLEKGRIKINGKGKRVIIPLDPVKGKSWEEADDDNLDARRLYQVIQSTEDTIEPNMYGEIHIGSPLSEGYNSDSELYNWEIENYESIARDSYSIMAILKKLIRNCCFISSIPKVFEKKMREYPSLVLTATESKPLRPLRYKERESLIVHVNEVSKDIGEQDRLQSSVETFTRQAARWWDTHQSRLQTYTTASTFFMERFGGISWPQKHKF